MDKSLALRFGLAALLFGGGGGLVASGAAGTAWLAARGILPPFSALVDDPSAWWDEVGDRWDAVEGTLDEDATVKGEDTGEPPPEPPPAEGEPISEEGGDAEGEAASEGDAVAEAEAGEGRVRRPRTPGVAGPGGMRPTFGRVGSGLGGVRAREGQGGASGGGRMASRGGESEGRGSGSGRSRGGAGSGGAEGAAPDATDSSTGAPTGQSTETAKSGTTGSTKSSGGSCNVDGVTKVDSTHYILSRSFVNKYIKDTDRAGQQGGANWASNKKGDTSGVKLYQLRCAPKQAGLKNGDVVKTVNGRPITSTVNAWAAYRDVVDAKSFTVNLKRKSSAMKIYYEVR